MCGRFVLKNAGQIPLRFGATADNAVRAALADHCNIAPTAPVPVVVEGMRQNRDDSRARRVPSAARKWPHVRSGGDQLGDDSRPALVGPATAFRRRGGLARPCLGAEILALLLESAHRVVALFYVPVILRDPVVLVAAGAVGDVVAECLADSAWVGVAPVRRHPLRRVSGEVERLAEEAPGGTHVALVAQQRVDEVPLPIDRPVQGAPAPVDLDVGLVRVPLRADLPAPRGLEVLRQHGREARLPRAHGLVREDEATCQKHLRQVAQAQLVAQSPHHHQQDDIGRYVQVIEGRTGALVAHPPTGAAAEGAVAEGGTSPLLGGRGHGAVGTRHGQLLHATANALRYRNTIVPTTRCLTSDASPTGARRRDNRLCLLSADRRCHRGKTVVVPVGVLPSPEHTPDPVVTYL